jgi:hypothetical protein
MGEKRLRTTALNDVINIPVCEIKGSSLKKRSAQQAIITVNIM